MVMVGVGGRVYDNDDNDHNNNDRNSQVTPLWQQRDLKSNETLKKKTVI